MDTQTFSEWLDGLGGAERVRALALIYSRLTIYTRQLFLPDRPPSTDQRVLEILHGLNEIHHTLANSLVDYASEESKTLPVHVLSQQLRQIETHYRLEQFPTPTIDDVRRYTISART